MGFARQMLGRAVMVFNEGGRGGFDEIAEHRVGGDETFHLSRSFTHIFSPRLRRNQACVFFLEKQFSRKIIKYLKLLS